MTIARWYEAARSARRFSSSSGREVSRRVEERRLEAGEGEVEARHAGDGEVVGGRVAVAREPVELAAARVVEPEEPRALVERLAGRVVERRAEHGVVGVRADVDQQRVPPAREQAEERRLDRLRLQVERGDVSIQMVDRDERQVP